LTKTKSVALLAPYDNVEPSSSGLKTDKVIRPSVTGALDLTVWISMYIRQNHTLGRKRCNFSAPASQ
jgi:hypothetical protein